MQVAILCGGRGTRLGAETEVRPKPMVEIGGKPILWHIIKYYSYFGHRDFILCALPLYSHMRRDQQDRVISAMREILG